MNASEIRLEPLTEAHLQAVRPIALGCHRDNARAAAFYQRHGFRPTSSMEGDDIYYLRYPGEE